MGRGEKERGRREEENKEDLKRQITAAQHPHTTPPSQAPPSKNPTIASPLTIPQQIHSASGPAPNTVSNSRLTTVRSAPAQRRSAFAYTIQRAEPQFAVEFEAKAEPCRRPGGEEVGVEVGVGVAWEEGGGEGEDVVSFLKSAIVRLCNCWIKGGEGRRGGGGEEGEETYRNEPSKMEWIRKSKKCQMKSTRSRFGVSDASVARERP